MGIGLVSKEIEKKTLYTILSRPVRRWEFIAGKYLGLLLTLVVNAVLMTVGFYVALLIFTNGLKRADAILLVAIYFIILQFMMMVAITLFFSTLHQTSCDKIGRVLIPTTLKKAVGIKGEIMIAGVLNKIAIDCTMA